MLANQVLPNPVQVEEKPLSPPVIQHDTEAEKQLIREVRPGAGGRVGGAGGVQLETTSRVMSFHPLTLGLALQPPFWSHTEILGP